MMREGFLMVKQTRRKAGCADIVFMPALTPLEAAVLPARERETYGTLGMIRYACEAGEIRQSCAQRAKIWVR